MPDSRAQRAQRIAKLYLAEGQPSLGDCAKAEGVSPMTAMRDLASLGIERRKAKPTPEPRRCSREGCENEHRPTRRQLEQGMGKFCSTDCSALDHRIHPKPVERACEQCDTLFTPDSDLGWHDVVKGWNKFCGIRCRGRAARGRRSRATKGELVTCGQCGTETWRYDCELERDRAWVHGREGWFCGKACQAEHRKLYPWPGYRNFVSPRASGRARQRMIGAREGRVAPAGGRRRIDPGAKAEEVLRLRAVNPRLGERAIAARLGVTRHLVREILAQHAA